MIFKNIKNGQVANIVDDYLIQEYNASVDWEVGSEEDLPKPCQPINVEPSYADKVNTLIRERYSLSDELALLRQRNVKQDEYQAYFAYCEECKSKAKEVI